MRESISARWLPTSIWVHRAAKLSDGDAAPAEGDIRTAIAVSMNPVRAEVSSVLDRNGDGDRCRQPGANGSPGFSSTGDYERSIR